MGAIFSTLLLFLVILSSCSGSSSTPSEKTSQGGAVMKDMAGSKFETCVKLADLFYQINHKTGTSPSPSPVTMMSSEQEIPFEFPLLKCFGTEAILTLKKHLGDGDSAKSGQNNVMGILILIVYRLLQFHIKRLFNCSSYDYAAPIATRFLDVWWEENPEYWFYILWKMILPGWHIIRSVVDGTAVLTRYDNVVSFETTWIRLIMPDEELARNNQSGKSLEEQGDLTDLVVPIYLLPSSFIGTCPPRGYTALTFAKLLGDAPVANEDVLRFLLRGVRLAFTLREGEMDVCITADKDVPSITDSRSFLSKEFDQPLPPNISIPSDLDEALRDGHIPMLSCYHPSMFKGSPKQFERMMSLIMLSILSEVSLDSHELNIIADSLGLPLAQYFRGLLIHVTQRRPDGTLIVGKFEKDTFVIYEEELTKERTVSFVIHFKEPSNIPFKALQTLKRSLYPFHVDKSPLTAGPLLIRRMHNAYLAKLLADECADARNPSQSTGDTDALPQLTDPPKRTKDLTPPQKTIPHPSMTEKERLEHLTEFAFVVSAMSNPTPHDIRRLAQKMSNRQRLFRTSLATSLTAATSRKIATYGVAHPSESIMAFKLDGKMIRSKRAFVLFPSMPNLPDLLIWVEECMGAQTEA